MAKPFIKRAFIRRAMFGVCAVCTVQPLSNISINAHFVFYALPGHAVPQMAGTLVPPALRFRSLSFFVAVVAVIGLTWCRAVPCHALCHLNVVRPFSACH